MPEPAEIKVIASNAVKEAFARLVTGFEAASRHRVAAVWGGTLDIAERISGGEVHDIVILPAERIDDLIRQGRLARGSRVDFVRSSIGVAVRPGAPRPDLASGAALAGSLLAARSIVLSSGPSSVHLLDLFGTMGIAAALAPKIRRLAPGASVGEALARGDGEIGFTQVSELVAVRGIDYAGPLPADIQHVTVFAMGLHAAAPAADAARQLMRFLTAPAAAPAIRHAGQEPA